MRFWEEMQEPAYLQDNHRIMIGNPDLVGESAYQSTDLNRLRGLLGGILQISTQSDLDAFRPQSGLAIVTMGDDIDSDIKAIFGTDNNKIEIHAYTIAGTGSSSGDVYQEGVSAIDGLTYRRYHNNITGWTDFKLAIDISRKINFIDWGDLAPYYTALVGRFYKVHGTGGDATSEYWYLCIQNYTGFQVDVDYTNEQYFYPISNGNIALTRRIPFIDWEADLSENYSLLKGQIIQMNGTGGDATSVYYYMCVYDITSTKTDYNPIDNPELFYDLSGRTNIRNRGNFADFRYGVVMVNDVFYDNVGIAYVCIQQVTYSLGGSNPPLTDTDYYKLLTNIDISRKIDFIDWSDLDPYYTALVGRFYKVHGTGGDATSDYWYLCIQNYTGWQVDVDYTNPAYFFDITGHNHLNDTLKPNVVEYQSGATPPTNVGSQYYDDTYKVLSTVLGNGVVLQNGLEMYVRIVNKTGSQLNDGQVVYISGAHGNRPTASLAIATSESASYVIGVCTENIANNQEGFVTVFGTVNGYNTSSFTDGAKLYLSATVAGELTTTRPVAPNHGVIVGIALNSTNNGAIFVNPNSGFELSELHDVDTSKTKTVPLDADYFLMQDTADGNIWKKVLKANTNEIYVGSSIPSHNEVLMIDNSADLLVYKSNTTATITPNNTLKVDKYNSNYAGGNTVLVDYPTFDTNKHIDYDEERVVVIKNTKAGTVTFIIETGLNTISSIEYNYLAQNNDTFDLDENKYAEISYLYTMTSATTCDVLIRIAT